MKKSVLLTTCGVVAALLGSGCASVFTGSSDQVTFTSQPEGARVQVNGMLVGRTPLTIPLKRSLSTPEVKLSLEGYEPQYVMIQNTFNAVACLDICCWPTFIVDLATGSIMKYSVLNYDIRLYPENEQQIRENIQEIESETLDQ